MNHGVDIGMPMIEEAKARLPWERISHEAKQVLDRSVPSLKPAIRHLPLKVFGLHSGFFYLPLAQGIAWGMEEPALRDLAVSLALGHAHFAIQDGLIDTGKVRNPRHILLSDACLLRFLDALQEIAEGVRDYRAAHDEHYAAYAAAIDRELAHRLQLRAFSAAEVASLGEKAAIGNTVLQLLCDRTGRGDPTALMQSVRGICTAFQLHDDVEDLREDYRAGNLTFPITLGLMRGLRLPEGGLRPLQPGVRDVEEAVFFSGAAEVAYLLARRHLQLALHAAQRAGAVAVTELVEACLMRSGRRIAALAEGKAALRLRSPTLDSQPGLLAELRDFAAGDEPAS